MLWYKSYEDGRIGRLISFSEVKYVNPLPKVRLPSPFNNCHNQRRRSNSMGVINNSALEDNIITVTDWIVNDCYDVKGEIKWLLEKLFVEQVEWVKEVDHVRTLNEDITNYYSGVLGVFRGGKCRECGRLVTKK